MPSPKPSRAIDTHTHVFSATAPAVAGARYRPTYAATLEALRREWSANGTSHGVIVQPSFFGTDNREMLAALALDPMHLRGVAVIDPSADVNAIAALDGAGVRAIRLNMKGAPDYGVYGGDAWKALYGRVHGRGWHVEVFVDAGRLPDAVAAFEATPVAVVFDHFGNPGASEAEVDTTFRAVGSLAASRPLFVKLSGAYRLGGLDPCRLADRWKETVGTQAMVWGSDWPWTAFEASRRYGALRQELRRWVDPASAPSVLWDNAARLYQFD